MCKYGLMKHTSPWCLFGKILLGQGKDIGSNPEVYVRSPICSIDVMEAFQSSKLTVTVRICYTAPLVLYMAFPVELDS